MAKKGRSRQQTPSKKPESAPRPAPSVPGNAEGDGIPGGSFLAGALLLILAVGVTGVLTANHLNALSLPGCRPGGACEQAAAGPWGKLPGTTWPISFVGLAYFLGLLVTWLSSKSSGVSAPLKLVVRFGVLVSLMYLVVLLVEKHLCWYCIATHASNLLFWLVIENCRVRPVQTAAWRPVGTMAVVFLLGSAALGATEWRGKKAEETRQETQLAESTQEIIQSASQPAPVEDTGTTSISETAVVERPWKGGFAGRYRWGPEVAAVRIVMITDYQCPDCKRSEADLLKIMNARSDVSVTIKHFPFCKDCNTGVSETLHPNACWAARAAETAGILRGPEGFWEMHKHLFDTGGAFTSEQLNETLNRFGYDRGQFIDIMSGQTTLNLVQQDIQEAVWLGLHYTPMIFINGKELKGVFAFEALSRAVTDVLATNPTPGTSELDQPPPASEKYINDWKEGPMLLAGDDIQSWPMGVQQAPALHVVMWGDYQEPNTAMADEIIRKYVSGRKDAQYVFRHYPVNQKCNPKSQLTRHENACRMSQAAEAAGMVYQSDGFWKVHEWLMKNQANYSDENLRAAVEGMGFLADPLFAKMDSPDVAQGIKFDCETGKALGLTSIPFIFVNQRFVPRWYRREERILERVFEAAVKESEEAKSQQAAAPGVPVAAP
ncbi:hypothetical protein B7486_13880 [cyanobacterium TDX16]|nr:hypothetical protein B7486_13880 [cyanobacterium TDX16]